MELKLVGQHHELSGSLSLAFSMDSATEGWGSAVEFESEATLFGGRVGQDDGCGGQGGLLH